MNQYLILFPCCIIAKGFSRSVIHDIQREELHFIPNDLFDFLELNNCKLLQDAKSSYNKKEWGIIDGYLDFLFSNEYAFIGSYDDTIIIKELSNNYDYPGYISNAIWELSHDNLKFQASIFEGLNNLKCDSIQIVSYGLDISVSTLTDILNKINKCDFLTNIEFVIGFSEELNYNLIIELCQKNLRINSFVVHSSDFDKIKEFKNGTKVSFTNKKIADKKCCGCISENNFCLNKTQIMESQSYNSCLNKKLSIDGIGNIKNCPSMPQSFGNIKNVNLETAFEHKDFDKYWNITKDQIDVCKDCEFRYICTDCRAYVENPEDDYSKPLKCGYNPYTSEWKKWSTNSLKQKAIKYYDMQEFIERND